MGRVATFTAASPPTSDMVNVCQTVVFGGLNAPCIDGTNMQCANGFACAGNLCTALLATGANCDGAAAALCEARLGDTCRVDPNAPATHVCTPLHLAAIGAQCGLTGTPQLDYQCSSVAICGVGPPTVCAARVAQGQPCSAAPDNCQPYPPGLACIGGTCQAPPPVSCP